ncbi:MAG TPA: thioredoxin family protein [Planctomycetota bacterium]
MILLLALQIDWKPDLDAALAEAKKSGRPVLLHFFKVDSTASERMMKDTFGNPEVAAFSAKALVHARLDVAKAEALALKHGVSEMPFSVLLSSAGERITALPGYLGPDAYKEGVERALAAWAKLQALKAEQQAEAAELWTELGDGRKAGAAYRKAATAAADPKARGALLAKALNQLNAVEAEDVVTEQILAVAADLDALDPALGYADDAAYARAMAEYNREDWDEAIKRLEEIVNKWPAGDRAPMALLGVADLYHHAKKDHKKAIASAQRVIDAYKGEWGERAKHLLEHIKAHQEKP